MFATDQHRSGNSVRTAQPADTAVPGGRVPPGLGLGTGGGLRCTGLRPTTHHELLHTDGEGCRVEQNLSVLGQKADDVLDEHHKVLRQQLIRLRRQNTTRSERSSASLLDK